MVGWGSLMPGCYKRKISRVKIARGWHFCGLDERHTFLPMYKLAFLL